MSQALVEAFVIMYTHLLWAFSEIDPAKPDETQVNSLVLKRDIFFDHLAITPDGKSLYVTSALFNKVFVVDTTTNEVVDTIPLGFNPIFPAITSDGTRVFTANVDSTVSVIDATTNTAIATIAGFSCPRRIAITRVPRSKDDCKDGGFSKFRGLGFPNQGQCVKYVNRHAN